MTISEAIWAAVNKETIAGVAVDTTPDAMLCGLVNDGPVQVVPTDAQDLAVYRSLIDHQTLYDALLIANHRIRGTDATISADSEFTSASVIWK